jgi:hypothetical protein
LYILTPFFRYLNYKKAEDIINHDIEDYFFCLRQSQYFEFGTEHRGSDIYIVKNLNIFNTDIGMQTCSNRS